ncbi:uncharacterized protein LOC126577694 [Anopheles aquasalis]|uniref:uncharacterized protein LOC126577694 n=1 Tax=Anopheles aquasalis TaxID=42839 RepID=UPI00215B5D9D|nr:uncharacterized protein LOC126577694 [Anopheles aquasalis]
MAHVECRRKPPKLCRRTFFLRNGSAPTRSEMSEQLGDELADVVLATLQPSQRAALPVDRMVFTEGHKSLTAGGRDSDKVRGQIHDHIMKIGDNVSQRLEGYWRKRVKETATSVVTADDLDFVRFECQQKIAIARDEERKRYERLLMEKEETMRRHFREEKDDLHRSYGEARSLWGHFVCRKVRTQAKQLLCQIAARYRVKLEQELNQRLQQETARMETEMEAIVRRALDHQKRVHEQTIEWLIYQYEEQLRFANEYSRCLQTVEIVREFCRGQQRPQSKDLSLEKAPDERFDALFDLKKSEDQIAAIADSIIPAYIQATDEDYAEMFPKPEDT